MFYQNDVEKYPKMKPAEESVEDRNIGIKSHTKVIKLSNKFSTKVKEYYVSLMRKYNDIFAWSYDDIKEYDTSIIQHTIPIKPGENPFKQKLRRKSESCLMPRSL